MLKDGDFTLKVFILFGHEIFVVESVILRPLAHFLFNAFFDPVDSNDGDFNIEGR